MNWIIFMIVSGWWGNNHLEKYEFANGKDDIPYFMENKKWLKPPTRYINDSSQPINYRWVNVI